MSSTTEIVARPDGAPDLLIRHWAAAGEAWASVLIVHGLAEHSGRYERTGAALASVGLEVAALDLRGAGASAGRRAYVERWAEYLDDVEWCLRALRDSAGGRPVVLLGHSLGGLIALEYATSGRPAPDLLVLSSPALDSTIPGWKRTVAGVLGRIAPTRLISNALDGEQLSRDPAVGAATSPIRWSRRARHSVSGRGAPGTGAGREVGTNARHPDPRHPWRRGTRSCRRSRRHGWPTCRVSDASSTRNSGTRHSTSRRPGGRGRHDRLASGAGRGSWRGSSNGT